MRNLVGFVPVLAFSLLFAASAIAESISPQEAAQNVGVHATVEGVVSQVSFSQSGTTFINFGGRYGFVAQIG